MLSAMSAMHVVALGAAAHSREAGMNTRFEKTLPRARHVSSYYYTISLCGRHFYAFYAKTTIALRGYILLLIC